MKLKINKHELFPTLVYHIPNFLNEKQCQIIYKFLKDKEELLSEHHLVLNNNNSKSSHSEPLDIIQQITQLNECKNIIQDLSQICKEYEKEAGIQFKENKIESWFNIQNKGSTLKQHCHASCVVAGGLYVNMPEGSAPLCFTNPNYRLQMYNYLASTKYAAVEVTSYPKAGDLLLWPSCLEHGSGGIINNADDRTVISFNVE